MVLSLQFYDWWHGEMVSKFVASIPLLEPLSKTERLQMATVMNTRAYEDGEYIIRQGSTGTAMFILAQGGAIATLDTAVPGVETQVREIRLEHYCPPAPPSRKVQPAQVPVHLTVGLGPVLFL